EVSPEGSTGRGVEREGARVGGAVDAAVADGDAVGPRIRRVEQTAPQQLAGLQVEGEHIAAHVLDVDDVSGDDRRRREGPGFSRGSREAESPRDVQAADVAALDSATYLRASRVEVEVRSRPVRRTPLPSATRERCSRNKDQEESDR